MSLMQAYPFHFPLAHQDLLFLNHVPWNSLLPGCCRLCLVGHLATIEKQVPLIPIVLFASLALLPL